MTSLDNKAVNVTKSDVEGKAVEIINKDAKYQYIVGNVRLSQNKYVHCATNFKNRIK
jgi:hypothetical protein